MTFDWSIILKWEKLDTVNRTADIASGMLIDFQLININELVGVVVEHVVQHELIVDKSSMWKKPSSKFFKK